MKCSKNVFKQYNDILVEIKDIKKDIKDTEDRIAKLSEEGTVVDKVTGGYGGIQGFKIEGFPEKEYNRRLKILNNRHYRLTERENDLLELRETIETEIDKIENSRDRQIIRGFFIDNKTQEELGRIFYVDQSIVSRTISKYFQ